MILNPMLYRSYILENQCIYYIYIQKAMHINYVHSVVQHAQGNKSFVFNPTLMCV